MNRLGRDAQVALDIASALTHSVYFRLFDMETACKRGFSQNCGDGEDTLSSYACQYYILFHIGSLYKSVISFSLLRDA